MLKNCCVILKKLTPSQIQKYLRNPVPKKVDILALALEEIFGEMPKTPSSSSNAAAEDSPPKRRNASTPNGSMDDADFKSPRSTTEGSEFGNEDPDNVTMRGDDDTKSEADDGSSDDDETMDEPAGAAYGKIMHTHTRIFLSQPLPFVDMKTFFHNSCPPYGGQNMLLYPTVEN